ncbi:MAG: hypothetical protein ACYTGR_04025, partial [Planctomycetota bacterium]
MRGRGMAGRCSWEGGMLSRVGTDGGCYASSPMDQSERTTEVRAALDRAIRALEGLQKADGHWCAELEGDSILQSEYLLMKFILGQERL